MNAHVFFNFAKIDVEISFMDRLLHCLAYVNRTAVYTLEVKIINLNG